MIHPVEIPLVTTIKERCRVCYTCVRECPAKAIRIADGQAEVLGERCIGCGNCVRVCSQHAKVVRCSIDAVEALLAGDDRVAACLAPSFPAEFSDFDWRRLPPMLRKLGFDLVTEVAFGADLVAEEYRKLLSQPGPNRYIATSCPAIVSYVERYHPEMVANLAPIVSPMVAQSRALRKLFGADLRIVFIGPCIAKKGEAASEVIAGEVDAAVTFAEIREMFLRASIAPQFFECGDFDGPRGGTGALFPISRGLLQAAEIAEDLVAGEVVAADGRTNFVEAIKEFEAGDLDARLLEVLCCNGCITGAGMTSTEAPFSRRGRISKYVRQLLETNDPAEAAAFRLRLGGLDLSRSYVRNDQRIPVPFEDEIRQILTRMGKAGRDDELNCGACGYDTCREHAIAIFKGLAESEMCLPNTIEKLRRTIGELAVSNGQLASTQEALMQSEKLASMGQLAAGIAHEVNNPLGVVLMYAHLLLDQCQNSPQLREDLEMVVTQADRCKKIVAGLLHFARQNKVLAQTTNLVELAESCIKTITIPEGVTASVRADTADTFAEVDPDQIAQVLTNLVTNALAAMAGGGMLTITIAGDDEQVRLDVADTGSGISKENLKKIFEPFFTTKQMGKGTGLGLAVTYGIVKMHSGDITVVSNADVASGPTGTKFTVRLPRRVKQG